MSASTERLRERVQLAVNATLRKNDEMNYAVIARFSVAWGIHMGEHFSLMRRKAGWKAGRLKHSFKHACSSVLYIDVKCMILVSFYAGCFDTVMIRIGLFGQKP